ncbi:MAG: type II toxin-antitoxin system HicB family antitoxin [Lachnospiraceae bacterium]|nr:type II toxin-antitoxin system HicB family antitoxin [Lachnospiraceae bacterium]
MAKYFYPAIFTKEKNGLYSVEFPDIENCYTSGEDLADAYEMAEDVLALTLYGYEIGEKTIPEARGCMDIQCKEASFVSLVKCDTMEYRRKHSGKAVKKTLSIPEWMNEEANRRGINFSQLLQEALLQELKL